MGFRCEFKLYGVSHCNIVAKHCDNNPIIDFEWKGEELSQDEAHKLLRKIYNGGYLDLNEGVRYVGLAQNKICTFKYRPYSHCIDYNRCGLLFYLPGTYESFEEYCFDSIDDFIKVLGDNMDEGNHIVLEELKDDVKGCSVTVGHDGCVKYSEHPKNTWCLKYQSGLYSGRKLVWVPDNSIKDNIVTKIKEIQTIASCLCNKHYYLSVEDLKKDEVELMWC